MIGELIARDVRRGFTGSAWLPIAFFLLVAALVPFAIGPDAKLLARIGPGILGVDGDGVHEDLASGRLGRGSGSGPRPMVHPA